MRITMYVKTNIYPLTNDTKCMASPEMPDIDEYYHMYVSSTFCMHFSLSAAISSYSIESNFNRLL